MNIQAEEDTFRLMGGFMALFFYLFAMSFIAKGYNEVSFAWPFTSLPGLSGVDNAQWMTLMLFGLQGWDFATDVNVFREISSRYEYAMCLLFSNSSTF